MKTLEEVLKKYVEVNGPANVKMGGEHLNLSVPGVTKLDASATGQADIYIVNKVGIDVQTVEKTITFIITSEDGSGLDSRSEAARAMSSLKHRTVLTSDTVIVYSTNKEILGVEDEHVEPEVEPEVETSVDPHDFYANSTTIPPNEGVPFAITGAEAEEELDSADMLEEEDEEDDEPKRAW